MSNTHDIRLAPLGSYPAGPCRDAVAAFIAARDKWAEASRILTSLTSRDAIDAARASDALGALAAAKEGKDPAEAGRPAEADLAARAADAQQAEGAYGTLMREAWGTLAAEVRAAAPQAINHWRAERDARAEAAREALEVLRDSERRWANAAGSVAYWSRAATDATANYGGYAVDGGGELPAQIHSNTTAFAVALDQVARAQDGRNYRQAPEDVPAHEAAAPGETVQSKRVRKRAPRAIRKGGE